MTTTLHDLVTSKGCVVADGAMGTQLFAAGLSAGWSPEEWNLSRPDDVRAVHRGYLQAGADLIVTNSFGGNCFRQALHGFEREVRELNAEPNPRETLDERLVRRRPRRRRPHR